MKKQKNNKNVNRKHGSVSKKINIRIIITLLIIFTVLTAYTTIPYYENELDSQIKLVKKGGSFSKRT